MIERFLQPPRTAGEFTADGVRVAGVLSMIIAGIGWGWVEVAVFALALLGLVLPRFLGLRPALDIAFSVTVLVAAWSSVFELYLTVPGWDSIVHFLLTGLTAVVIHVLLAEIGVVPDIFAPGRPTFAAPVLTVAFGLALSSLWEFGEWIGHTFIDDRIFVSYDDTIKDMAVGGFGALVAGLTMRLLLSRVSRAPKRDRHGRSTRSAP